MTRTVGNFEAQDDFVLQKELEKFTRRALEDCGSNDYAQCASAAERALSCAPPLACLCCGRLPVRQTCLTGNIPDSLSDSCVGLIIGTLGCDAASTSRKGDESPKPKLSDSSIPSNPRKFAG